MDYALFIRGINVGAANRIKMSDLTLMLERAGFQNVRTYIQTGNVRVGSRLDAEKVMGAVETVLLGCGIASPKVAVVSWSRLEELVSLRPFERAKLDGGKPLGIFLCGACCSQKIDSLPGADRINYHRVEPEVLLASFRTDNPANFDLKRTLEKPLGAAVTVRYWNVVEDFVEKLG